MKKISLIIMVFSFIAFNSCSEEDTLADNLFNYIAFGSSSYEVGVDVGGTATVDVEVLTSKSSGSARSFSISVDPTSTAAAGSYTVPATVTVPSGSQVGTLSVELSDVDLGIGVNSLILNFEDEEGLFHGDATTVNYTQNCNEISLTLDLTFDSWPDEASWEITDTLGGVVASGENYDGQTSSSEAVVLCIGRDYTFTISDSYGDGGTSYSLSNGGTVLISGGPAFGDGESQDFDTN